MSHPDADLHPSATGLAAELVEQHSKEQPLVLWSGWFCPFVQRVWLVLEEKKIPYQYKEVNPYHKEPSFLALNPRGLVPTLEVSTADGHKPLYESTVLLEYLEDAYPNHGPSLYPNNPYDKAKVKIWADFVTSRIIPAFHRFLQYQPNTGSGTPAGLDKLRQEFLGKLVEFTREMDPVGPYFTGKEPVLVDFVLAPWAVRLWVFDEFKGGLGKPEKAEDQKVWERWGKWLEAVKGRDSIKRTTSDAQHYLPIYKRYADDKAQSELAKATRLGKGVP